MSLKSVVLFQDETAVSGGRERLGLEGLRLMRESGLRAVLLTYRYDEAAVFGGRYDPEVVARRRGPAPEPARRTRLASLRERSARILWLRRQLSRLGPDIVLTDGEGPSVIDAYLATLFTRRRYAAIVYGSLFAFRSRLVRSLVFRRGFREISGSVEGYRQAEPEQPPRLDPAARLSLEAHALLRRLAVRGASRLFVFSEQLAWEVSQLYGRRPAVFRGAFPERIFRHQPSTDVKKGLGLQDRRMILTVGRLEPKKRVDLCLSAFARLKTRTPDAFLIIAGAGSQEAALRRQAERLGLERDVLFAGFIPDVELWDYYGACDLFVCLDCADFDLAPYEALALGRKVVWSREMTMAGLEGHPLLFPCRPTEEATALAMAQALDSPAAGPDGAARLRPFTFEEYFSRLSSELAACAETRS